MFVGLLRTQKYVELAVRSITTNLIKLFTLQQKRIAVKEKQHT